MIDCYNHTHNSIEIYHVYIKFIAFKIIYQNLLTNVQPSIFFEFYSWLLNPTFIVYVGFMTGISTGGISNFLLKT